MTRPRAPVFLARRPYRRRRLMDAARMLPVFGALFVLLPILGDPGADDGRRTAQDGIYLFVVWGVLIAVARLLAPGLADGEADAAEEEEDT